MPLLYAESVVLWTDMELEAVEKINGKLETGVAEKWGKIVHFYLKKGWWIYGQTLEYDEAFAVKLLLYAFILVPS